PEDHVVNPLWVDTGALHRRTNRQGRQRRGLGVVERAPISLADGCTRRCNDDGFPPLCVSATRPTPRDRARARTAPWTPTNQPSSAAAQRRHPVELSATSS